MDWQCGQVCCYTMGAMSDLAPPPATRITVGDISNVSGGEINIAGTIVHAAAGATVIINDPDTAVRTRAATETASAGVMALVRLANTPGARDIVVGFQTDFEAAMIQIDTLNRDKFIHDLFQNLENAYYLISHDQRRLPEDELAWQSILINEPEVASIVDDLLDAVRGEQPPPRWTRQLEQVRGDMRRSVEELDHRLLYQAVRQLHRVLDREPSRVNARLVAAARALRLAKIVNAMASLQTQLSNTGGTNSLLVQRIGDSVSVLDELDKQLVVLVSSHDLFQALDDDLRRIETNIVNDTEELALAWPDIQANLAPLLNGPEDRWLTSIRQTMTDLDRALAQQMAVDIRKHFRRLKSQINRRFRQIDLTLLKQSREMRRIGTSINLLLQVLQ